MLVAVTTAACGDRGGDPPPRGDGSVDSVATSRDVPAPDIERVPGELAPGVSVIVRKVDDWEYVLHGRVGPVSAVELTMEDGHNILFGPERIPVADGRFRIGFVMDSTDLPQAIAFLQSAEGTRLAVVRVPVDRELIIAGEPFDTLASGEVHR